MKDFALTGRSSWIFQFLHFVVSSSIRDILTKSHRKLITYNFWSIISQYIGLRSPEENDRGEKK
jgi:hypothetical protein